MNHEELVEISIRHARENPADMALWLACDVLLSDKAGLGDDELASRLIGLQDRLSDLTRVRYGIPSGEGSAIVMPTLEERVERLEAWTEVLMRWISRIGDFPEPLLTELESVRKLYGRADDPHREEYAQYEEAQA